MNPWVAIGDERRLIRIPSDFPFPQQAEETGTSGEDSDTGSEALGLGEQTDERLVRNQEYFAAHVGGFTTILQESIAGNGRQIQTIINPTLSKMSSCCLHPNMYTNIQPIPLLSQMAHILGTDPSWEVQFTNSVACNQAVRAAFRAHAIVTTCTLSHILVILMNCHLFRLCPMISGLLQRGVPRQRALEPTPGPAGERTKRGQGQSQAI